MAAVHHNIIHVVAAPKQNNNVEIYAETWVTHKQVNKISRGHGIRQAGIQRKCVKTSGNLIKSHMKNILFLLLSMVLPSPVLHIYRRPNVYISTL